MYLRRIPRELAVIVADDLYNSIGGGYINVMEKGKEIV